MVSLICWSSTIIVLRWITTVSTVHWKLHGVILVNRTYRKSRKERRGYYILYWSRYSFFEEHSKCYYFFWWWGSRVDYVNDQETVEETQATKRNHFNSARHMKQPPSFDTIISKLLYIILMYDSFCNFCYVWIWIGVSCDMFTLIGREMNVVLFNLIGDWQVELSFLVDEKLF